MSPTLPAPPTTTPAQPATTSARDTPSGVSSSSVTPTPNSTAPTSPMATLSPPASIAPPPPPPNSVAYARARAESRASRRSQGSISRRTGPHFADYLTKVQEETPGAFYESSIGVPENSLASHSMDGGSSPRSDRTNLQPTTLNLPHIDERLEQLPPPAACQSSSPPSSICGENSVAEPLAIASQRLAMNTKATQTSPVDAKIGGVREQSDWSREINQDFTRDLARLQNLAVDDNMRDPSKTIEVHYKFRLNLLLNDKNQKILYGNIGDVPLPSTVVEPGTPTPHQLGSVHAAYVNWSEFKELRDRVDDLQQKLHLYGDLHSTSQKEINILKTENTELKEKVSTSEKKIAALETDVTLLKKIAGGSGVDLKENDLSQIV